MNERLITHLRHVDLAVPDHDRQLDVYTTTWGLAAEATDDGIAHAGVFIADRIADTFAERA